MSADEQPVRRRGLINRSFFDALFNFLFIISFALFLTIAINYYKVSLADIAREAGTALSLFSF